MRGGWTLPSLGKTQVYLYKSLGSPVFESVQIFKDSLCPAVLLFYTSKAGKLHSNGNRVAEKLLF